jgi:5-methylcytosine-specific restriction endonuclease McrA
LKNQKLNKKKQIKKLVWNKWIGEEIGKSKCCKLTDITQLSFHCGHIIAESNGGELKLDNLKPICQSCNSSIGSQNMNDFIKKYNL